MAEMMEALKPCAYCGAQIDHIEGQALSFSPPRTYHEFKHPWNDCVALRGKLWSFADNQADREKFVTAWNARPSQPMADEQGEIAALVERFDKAAQTWRIEQAGSTPQHTSRKRASQEYIDAKAALFAALSRQADRVREVEAERDGWKENAHKLRDKLQITEECLGDHSFKLIAAESRLSSLSGEVERLRKALGTSLVAMSIANALPGVSDEYDFGPAIEEATTAYAKGSK